MDLSTSSESRAMPSNLDTEQSTWLHCVFENLTAQTLLSSWRRHTVYRLWYQLLCLPFKWRSKFLVGLNEPVLDIKTNTFTSFSWQESQKKLNRKQPRTKCVTCVFQHQWNPPRCFCGLSACLSFLASCHRRYHRSRCRSPRSGSSAWSPRHYHCRWPEPEKERHFITGF